MSEDNAIPRPKMVAPDGSRVETGSALQSTEPPQEAKRVAPPIKRSTELDQAPRPQKAKITSCAVCGGAVSSVAPSCPHCGHVLRVAASQVSVIDIQMPFWSMVGFMVRWALASLPAIIILATIVIGVLLFLGSFSTIWRG